MGREVVIIGGGMTKFGEHWDKGLRDLVLEAGIKAIEDAGIEGKDIEAVYVGSMAPGSLTQQEHLAALLVDQMGLNPIPATRVEAACASGGLALREAYLAIKSGEYDLVVVGGVEKMTDLTTNEVTTVLGGAGDQEWELFFGATFPSLYAFMMTRYMHKYNAKEEDFAEVAVKNHYHGSMNPLAQFQKPITVETVMKSKYVAYPVKVFDSSPITDGAAALILASKEKARQLKAQHMVEIIASSQASDTLALSSRASITEIRAAKVAAEKAYKQAKVNARDVDVAEVHDCFTVAEVLAIEALGFYEKGEGYKAARNKETYVDGQIAVNTSGGLKACGHPVGATGIKQAYEIFLQLTDRAGKRQRKDANIGLTHNIGGSGATAVIHIMKRV